MPKQRDVTIKRIKKLLALAADNPSPVEAAAAALKAQRLIAEHSVGEGELYERDDDEVAEAASAEFRRNMWSLELAQAISDGFRCRCYRSSERYRDGLHHRMVFVGHATDAQAAAVTFDRLLELGNRLADGEARAAREEFGSARGVRDSFLTGGGRGGYVGGIRSELERQSHELMLVRAKEVDDYYEGISRGFGTVSRRPYRYVEDYSERGYAAGRDALRSTRLGGQGALVGVRS